MNIAGLLLAAMLLATTGQVSAQEATPPTGSDYQGEPAENPGGPEDDSYIDP